MKSLLSLEAPFEIRFRNGSLEPDLLQIWQYNVLFTSQVMPVGKRLNTFSCHNEQVGHHEFNNASHFHVT